TDSERHEAMICSAGHDVENRLTIFTARGYFKEAELVRPRLIVGLRCFHRFTGVEQINELHALDDAAILDVAAGVYTSIEAHGFTFPRTARATAESMSP